MRHYFDRDWNYAGSSMQSWEILLLLCFPIALILLAVFLPILVYSKYASREDDLKYEREHPELLDGNSGWYPWHRYSIPYTIALAAWVVALIISMV